MILGASVIASDWPSRDLTVRFWPSSFSTVPRTRTGAGAGGVWASAGTTNRLMIATASAVLRMVDPPLSVLLHQVTQKWRGTLVFSAHISVSGEWRPAGWREGSRQHRSIVEGKPRSWRNFRPDGAVRGVFQPVFSIEPTCQGPPSFGNRSLSGDAAERPHLS